MKLVREFLYSDLYYLNTLNESVLNEEFNIEKLRNIISKISNKTKVLNKFIQKFNQTKDFNIKKRISTILIMLFLTNFAIDNSIFSKKIIGLSGRVAKETSINVKKLKEISEEIIKLSKISAIDHVTAKTSDLTKSFIKEHEKLRLTAYALGDGKITIGYGHSYYENKSPYKVGDKITKEKAEKLFLQDIHNAENGIKRMLSQWKEQGIEVEIDQHMFDSMVSMAFNIGISGLRKSEFVKHLKNKDYIAAAEKIKTTRVSSKFPGLIPRRQQEYELFSKNLK